MVGIDASLVLCYRDEYNKVLGTNRGDFSVNLVNEWLINQTVADSITQSVKQQVANAPIFSLLSHCTEKTAVPVSDGQWQTIFNWFGLNLNAVSVGCCGMAGTFGHEADHLQESTGIYELSWKHHIDNTAPEQLLVTGYSCRSQVARFAQFKPKHPVQALLTLLP